MQNLTHVDADGNAVMVDVSRKRISERIATAAGKVIMMPETLRLIMNSEVKKGDVLGVAQLAGIMGAKRTSELIPLCHPLMLERLQIDFSFQHQSDPDEAWVEIHATASMAGKTGVEMEALVAVSGAALTIYDMCKSGDRGMVIEAIRLEEKSGGRSGHYDRDTE